ncbi:MAG: SAM-dependent methyltransferase [SAR324 cluster bacterium]|nr:SAM-dependent methyltransferase [SAR324 cluster bacterium]
MDLSIFKTKPVFSGYLAPEGFIQQVLGELEQVFAVYDRLIFAEGPPQQTFWSQNVWKNPRVLQIASINEAAKQLRQIQRNWCLYSICAHRRAHLIQEKLPHLSLKPLTFPASLPQLPMGSWTLLAPDFLIASSDCSSLFQHGQLHFEENRTGPPSRAYLKLWEALTLAGKYPVQGERCLEIGASPGGWSWVLEKTGADVLCVDRSELIPELMRSPRVTFRKGDAFAILPEKEGGFDWIFSDVICYPEKLLSWIHTWLATGAPIQFVCTIKFQGQEHYEILHEFAKIPHSRILHLSHNKHELTWIRTVPSAKK